MLNSETSGQIMNTVNQMKQEGQDVKVFAYGSLLWKPDFRYEESVFGYILGYKRRFWQGNVTHRGTEENIGRVATLVPSKNEKVWGKMFIVREQEAKEKALNGLTNREVSLGGYDVISTTFYSREGKPSTVIVFMATQTNKHYLGPASIDKMAIQIVNAVGPCGTNIEYVTKMTDYIRNNIPEDDDEHLFQLDRRIREIRDQKTVASVKEFFENRQDN